MVEKLTAASCCDSCFAIGAFGDMKRFGRKLIVEGSEEWAEIING